jgi:hypothetical protein
VVIGCAVEYTRSTSAICSASKQLTSEGFMIRPEFETALTRKSPCPHSPLASDGIPPFFDDIFQFLG